CGYYPNSTFVHMDVREKSAFWIDFSRPGEPPRYNAPNLDADEGTSDVGEEAHLAGASEGAEDAPNVTTGASPPVPSTPSPSPQGAPPAPTTPAAPVPTPSAPPAASAPPNPISNASPAPQSP
ncbi:MAG TPA: hypothetical protein VGI39_24155, partial [Polyangiaceae bacterium]